MFFVILLFVLFLVLVISFVFALMESPKLNDRLAYQQIAGFDLSFATERYAHKKRLAVQRANRVHQEFCRYFTLMRLNPRTFFGLMSEEIDEYWHELLCCTSLYRRFCQETMGRFIDHDPGEGGGTAYARTWKAYHLTFGEEPDQAIWPRPDPKSLQEITVSRPSSATTDDGYIPLIFVDSDNNCHHGHSHSDGGHHADAGHADAGHSCGGHGCGGHGCGGHGCGGGGCGGH